jgi:hypothetical protein
VVDRDSQDMCTGLLAKHAAHHQGDWPPPVLGPVLKLLTDLGNAMCLWRGGGGGGDVVVRQSSLCINHTALKPDADELLPW